jgi:hypothetical protein
MSATKRQNLLFIRKPNDIAEEVKYVCSMINREYNFTPIEQAFNDTLKLFRGRYEGFKACNTRYHDLDHSVMVFLATARLVHALVISGRSFKDKDIDLCLIASLLHDAGFIQSRRDVKGTGAKYSIGHEKRSVEFLHSYLAQYRYTEDEITDCSHMVECTILMLSPKEIPFRNDDIELLGKIVGTADLVAQIADRIYLEKLLYLYQEFEEAHVPGFDSELELLKKTEAFYRDISRKRIDEELGGVASLMHLHFKERWGIDKDLYEEYIQKNICYLRKVLQKHQENYRNMLKRGGIVQSLNK